MKSCILLMYINEIYIFDLLLLRSPLISSKIIRLLSCVSIILKLIAINKHFVFKPFLKSLGYFMKLSIHFNLLELLQMLLNFSCDSNLTGTCNLSLNGWLNYLLLQLSHLRLAANVAWEEYQASTKSDEFQQSS